MTNLRKLITVLLLTLSMSPVFGQSSYIPFNDYGYWIIDRYSIIHNDSLPFTTSIKPFNRSDVAYFANHLAVEDIHRPDFGKPKNYRYNIHYLELDNWEESQQSGKYNSKAFWKYFYVKRNAWYSVDAAGPGPPHL